MEIKSAYNDEALGYKPPEVGHFLIGKHGSKARLDKARPKQTKVQRRRARASARRIRKIRVGRAR